MYIRSPFNGTSDWLRLHSPSPDIPHESMSRFWSKVKDEAIRINKSNR